LPNKGYALKFYSFCRWPNKGDALKFYSFCRWGGGRRSERPDASRAIGSPAARLAIARRTEADDGT